MPGTQPHGLEGYPPLRKSAFKSFLPRAVFSLAWVFMTPAYLALNWVVSIFRPTTDEIVKFRRLWLPIACIMLIVSVPIALFALPFYILSHLGRRAFTYHVYAERTKRSISKTEWTIVSCNAHLLPEALARKYNLRNTSERAKSLAVRIAASNIQRHSVNFNNVLKDFPTSDFVCMQQVYDRTAVERILFHLHQSFPFIVEDTGVLHWRSHRLSAGSGLMLLSKYPIMDAEFKTFSGSAGADGRFCRGLLLAKVHLFKKNKPEKRRFVGYIFVTELHSSNPDIRRQQLEEIERFTHNFRERTSNPGEVVGFQAIAGEFHFDNVSQVHNTNWEHNLFTRYQDPFSVAPGRDQSWSLTTRLDPARIHEPTVAVPSHLTDILLNPNLRMDYIAPVPKMEEFVPGINRTMRLLLQHAVGRQLPSRVQHAAFVTALSHVTPSLPLMVTFTIGESDHHRHQQQQQQQQQQHHQSASRLSRALSRHGDEEEADAVSTHTRLSAALRVDSEPTELYRMSGVLDPNALLPLGAKEGGKQLGTAQIGGGAGGPIQVQEYDLDTSSGGESSSEEESGADQAVFVDMSEI